MKTIGMIGGMSWESSIEYYRIINQTVRDKLGGLHSAKCVMYSVDFAEIEALQHQGKWGEATRMMIDAAKNVERGGADFVIICTNTMHKMADDVKQALDIPPSPRRLKPKVCTRLVSWGPNLRWNRIFTGDGWSTGTVWRLSPLTTGSGRWFTG